MKQLSAFFIITLVLITGCTDNDNQEIKEVVNHWNELHTTKIEVGFDNIYADEVFFYGRILDKQNCVENKMAYLKNDFTQRIISRVTISYPDKNLVRCDFDKESTYHGKTSMHKCYLLVQRMGDKYLIAAESEYAIDAKIGSSPALQPKSNTWVPWLPVLLILLTIGYVAVVRYKKHVQQQDSKQAVQDWASVQSVPATRPIPTALAATIHPVAVPTPLAEVHTLTNEEKGKAFETYVIDRFDKAYFKLKEWRSDKIHNGVYAESNKHPDLEWEYLPEHIKFATECKWRAAFFHQQVDWAKDYQLKNYQKFAAERNMAVFVIIGIGGHPSAPNAVYILPLEKAASHQLHYNELRLYRRMSLGNFYLNSSTMELM